jgi:23S rRNA (adenine2503-C2)-methyltransferase
MEKKCLCGLTLEEIIYLIAPHGFSAAQASSIAISIYKKGTSDISDFTKIPKNLKEILHAEAFIGTYPPVRSEKSIDKSIKYLFKTETGKEFETVYIPDNKRNTVCVSTQSGCRMGCPFCVTARYGFRGNLSAGDIVNQLISIPDAGKVTHVVFMGMGEPMDNLENVLKACEIINAEWGLAVSPRNVTVSTVGITDGIEKFLKNSRCNLTLSLYSPFINERIKVIPAEKQYPSHRIIEIMRNYPVLKRRRLSIAYIMIKDINDTDQHLEGLKKLLTGSAIRVNLLPYHSFDNDSNCTSSAGRMQFFKHELVVSGISASIRASRGTDISAACGLLASGLNH